MSPGSAPSLSNLTYDELVVDKRQGPFVERVSREMAESLCGAIGQREPTEVAPPGVFPVLFLKALNRSMGGIPANSILAGQEVAVHRVLPVDTDVSITTWVGAKEMKRKRPFVTLEFDIRDGDDQPVASGRKVIVWPTGPGEAAA